MSSIIGSCYSNVILKKRESRINGGSHLQYNGLRAIETVQMPASSAAYKPKAVKCGRVRATPSPVSSPKRETDPKKRIIITGMGLVSVFGSDIDNFYNKLIEGQSGISLIDRFDASSYTMTAGDTVLWLEKEPLTMPTSVNQVLETMDKTRIGVLVGSGMGGLKVFSDGVETLVQRGYKKISPFFIPYSITNMGSALLAIDTGLMGPNYSISTACATANYCFFAAANHIRRGDADIIVAGGTEAALTATGVGGFIACRALSQRNDEYEKASRPWDTNRDGCHCELIELYPHEQVMESLEHALKRGAPIIAEYLGGAVTCDAHHMTDPRADGLGVSSCIAKSLVDAGVSPEEVNYINAHATTTLAGDLAEVNAIKKVFKDTSEIKMNGTKSMIGHGLGAAGGIEAIATIKAIKTGWLHPTINQYNLEPQVDIDTVPNVKKQHKVNVGISNSFGFGGHNSVVVFAPYKL
ncbi:hypothetical protein K7X08_013388 [Anisodus acutangulus]|uniref:3-oxoacyl-[acyl-carrier-protein] synthase n=1 Tax=Anisodus acutangulus TaxID=402998 RepID=A0A9Q1RHB7_9SOLA|nr:hypothetical protein K7X08_013388 [Anisodus acutangulus]